MHDQSHSQQPGTAPDWQQLGPAFKQLCDVIARLRSPTGCPWDRVQTLESIKPYTLEETYELLEAIDSGDDTAITEELGDVLLQVVLDAQIGADEGRFDLIAVVECITHKMISRHPHVFGDALANDADEVRSHWQRVKSQEKQRDSIFDGLPIDLPQLAKAMRITKKAAQVGYDFPHRDMLFEKLNEEITELQQELYEDGQAPDIAVDVNQPHTQDEAITDADQRDRVEAELGDILFVIANIARRWQINPEEALRRSNRKFMRRFQAIERGLKAQNRTLEEASLTEMEALYQQEKQREQHETQTHCDTSD